MLWNICKNNKRFAASGGAGHETPARKNPHISWGYLHAQVTPTLFSNRSYLHALLLCSFRTPTADAPAADTMLPTTATIYIRIARIIKRHQKQKELLTILHLLARELPFITPVHLLLFNIQRAPRTATTHKMRYNKLNEDKKQSLYILSYFQN